MSLQGSKIQLDILVENMGRVNFLKDINRQRKGKRIYFTLFESGYPSQGREILTMFTVPVNFRLFTSGSWTGAVEAQGTVRAYIPLTNRV